MYGVGEEDEVCRGNYMMFEMNDDVHIDLIKTKR